LRVGLEPENPKSPKSLPKLQRRSVALLLCLCLLLCLEIQRIVTDQEADEEAEEEQDSDAQQSSALPTQYS
jgi:hypothetical protein